jgi:uncharacterized protein YjbI with pentapeptide repeats
MSKERVEAAFPLTRADVELLLSQLEHSAQLDLSSRDLQQIDLSYMDLRGANLQKADLRGANLRGTNLSGADLSGADLGGADLDGADLSRAHLGDTEAKRVRFARAKLGYAILRDLDLRGFDLTELNLYHADLSGTDLRGAVLRGADLRGADLSGTLLHGPELQGAILYRGAFLRERGKQANWGEVSPVEATAPQPALMQEPPLPEREQETQERNYPLSEREAYLFGMNVLLAGSDAAKLHQLFPLGFSFAYARQHFDAWLIQASINYNEQEVQALWIGFAHRICDLYYENEPAQSFSPFTR